MVVMLLVVATGLLVGLWMQPISARAWTCRMLASNAVIIRNCPPRQVSRRGTLAHRIHARRTRFVLLDLLYGLC